MALGRKGIVWVSALVAAAVAIGVGVWAATGRCRIEGNTPEDRGKYIDVAFEQIAGCPVQPNWDGWMGPGPGKNGTEVPLDVLACTYGINEDAYQIRHGDGKVILTDYDSNAIFYRTGTNVQASLKNAARHLGRPNVLYADNVVRSHTPMEIDPQMPGRKDELWKP